MYKYQLMEIEIMNDDSNGYNKYQEENKMNQNEHDEYKRWINCEVQNQGDLIHKQSV